MTTPELGNSIWRDFVVNGVASSGINKPEKAKIREWAAYIESLTMAAGYGNTVWKATKASLNSDLAHDAETPAVVYADSTATNNGIYLKDGATGAGSWSQIITYLPGHQFVSASDSSDSTANTYQMTANPFVSGGGQLIFFTAPQTNTSEDVTVSFDGGPPYAIKKLSGSKPSVGGLQANMPVMGVVSGSDFILYSDEVSAALLAQMDSRLRDARSLYAGGFATDADADNSFISAGIVKVEGASYFNTTNNTLKFWDGSFWQPVALPSPSAKTPQDYGADGTAANDGPAFAALFAAELSIFIPNIAGGYDLGTQPTIPILEGQQISSNGAKIRQTGGDSLMFDADSVSNWSWTGNTYIEGGLVNRVDYQPLGVITTGGSATVFSDAGGSAGGANNTLWPQRPAFASTGSTNAATVHVRTGPNAGLSRAVVSTAGNTITTEAFPNAFAAGNEYVLMGNEGFIRIKSCSSYKLSGVTTQKMRGAGVHITGAATATGQYGDEGQLGPLFAKANMVGYWVEADAVRGPGAEYNQLSSINANACITGAIVGAGNQLFTNLNLNGNVEDGAIFMDGYNNAHGVVSGAQCNHNGRFGWVFYKVTNGQTIMASHTYERGILQIASKGIQFNGGIYSCPRIFAYGTRDNELSVMRDMYMPGGYGELLVLNENSTRPKDFVLLDCYGPGAYTAGVSVNDAGLCYVFARRGRTSTQTMDGHTNLIFPTKTFDRRQAYDAATGIFTCPPRQSGMYRVKATLYFSGTGVTTATSYVQINVDGASPQISTMNAPFGTTILTAETSRDVYLDEGDTVRISATASGTGAVTFGGATWESQLVIQRIA